MFDKEFFPTPPEVISLMLQGLDLNNKQVLEPSAGKGDIVDAVGIYTDKRVHAYEKSNDLCQILKSKCHIAGNDFFEARAEDVSHVDVVLMNPPFSNADKHITHAIEIMPEGSSLVALCNYETIDNSYSFGRKRLLRLIETFGGESENIGDVFSSAERTTGIDIGLIRLTKPVVSQGMDYEGFYLDADEEVGGSEGLMPYNEVREIVMRYVGALKAYDDFEKSAEILKNAIGPVVGTSQIVSVAVEYNKTVTTKDEFARSLQKKSWEWIIRKMNIGKFVTSGVMKDINLFVEKQTQYPFTMKNIYRMMDIIIGTRQQTMERAIVEVFDKITLHHKKNRENVEGWKTNKHYMVGQKFILEYVCEVSWGGSMDFHYRGNKDKLQDFTKALCFITGESVIHSDLSDWKRDMKEGPYFGTWYDWGFFQIKGFKKGTLHVKFKDRKHWELFNRAVGEIKGFPLPESI